MKPVINRNAPREAPNSSSIPPPQVQLSGGQVVPIKPFTVKCAELPSVQPSVLGFPVTPSQFSVLSEDEVTGAELGQDQSLEDPR